MNRNLRSQFIAAKIQAAAGVYEAPTLSDLMLVGDINKTPLKIDMVKSKMLQGYLGNKKSRVTTKTGVFSFPSELVGSGTPENAPPLGIFLRAAAMQQKTIAVAHAGVALGGASGYIDLAATASATEDIYIGAAIDVGGVWRTVVNYEAAPNKRAYFNENLPAPAAAGTAYTFPKQTYYAPVSSGYEQLSMVFDDNGLYHKYADVRANVKGAFKVGAIAEATIDIQGIPQGRLIGAVTGGAKPTFSDPQPVSTEVSGFIRAFGKSLAFHEMSFDLGAQLGRPKLSGEDYISIRERAATTSITVKLSAADEDFFYQAYEDETQGSVWLSHGLGDGHRFVTCQPFAQVVDIGEVDEEGEKLTRIDFSAIPSAAGGDEILVAQL